MTSPEPRFGTAELEEWIAAAKAGSREALGKVLEVCRPYLLIIANKELEADLQAKVGPSDLVQECCAKAQTIFPRFDGRERRDLLGWLRQILLNELAGYRERYRQTRKRDIAREIPLADAAPAVLANAVIDPAPTPQTRALEEEERAAVERALEWLPERHRRAIRLRHMEHRSFAEVGQELGCSAGAARKVWLRAMVQLRALWESHP
jgi:RNA polymerase sigma-70 factor (ECF subfamily)